MSKSHLIFDHLSVQNFENFRKNYPNFILISNQPKFGPKLMTAGNQSVGGGSNYQLHNIPYQQNHGNGMPTAQSVPALSPMGGGVMGGIPQGGAMGYNNYEQHQAIRQTTSPQNRFDPNNSFGNYSETKIAKFGENGNPLLAASQNNINQNGYQSG